jgi:hypothetical protein
MVGLYHYIIASTGKEGASMLATLAMIFMGWPAIIGTCVLCSAGLVSKQPALLVLGALLVVPFAWYLSMTPLFQTIGLFLPLLLLSAAYVLSRGRRRTAELLLLPFAGIVLWLAVTVLAQ